jgi:hypothetical protein
VGAPLLLQALLGRGIPAGPGPLDETTRQLGYTCTGLVLASALLLARRSRRARAGLGAVAAERRGALLAREILAYSVLCALSSVFGVAYYTLGGAETERYARTFIALTSVMFFVFVPRLRTWRDAAQRGYQP